MSYNVCFGQSDNFSTAYAANFQTNFLLQSAEKQKQTVDAKIGGVASSQFPLPAFNLADALVLQQDSTQDSNDFSAECRSEEGSPVVRRDMKKIRNLEGVVDCSSFDWTLPIQVQEFERAQIVQRAGTEISSAESAGQPDFSNMLEFEFEDLKNMYIRQSVVSNLMNNRVNADLLDTFMMNGGYDLF